MKRIKMNANAPKFGLFFALLVALSACGGGGASDGSNSGGSTPISSGGTTAPALVERLQSPVTPHYQTNLAFSHQLEVFNELNKFRTSQQLGPLIAQTTIDLATLNHHNYIQKSFDANLGFHIEAPGKEFFTGKTVRDRVIAAGYPASDATEVATPNIGADSVIRLSAAIYHRQEMQQEHYSHVGISSLSSEQGNASTIINLAVSGSSYQNNAGNYVGYYPYDGQTNVPVHNTLENPWPFPELPKTLTSVCTQLGYPINIQVQKLAKLDVEQFSLKEESSNVDVPVRLLSRGYSSVDGAYNGVIKDNYAAIVPKAPLKKGTKYVATFLGAATGSQTGAEKGILKINKVWKFETGQQNITICPGI